MILPVVLLLQASALPAPAAAGHGTIVADTVWSQALGVRKQLIIYLPASYQRSLDRRYPVAYYLHGLWGRETDWTKFGGLDAVMDSLISAGHAEMIVVMPDGDDGWYTTWNALPAYDACVRAPPANERADSYCVPWPHYDDYIARDVVRFVDERYRSVSSRGHRAIAGFSMGGYGAITLALAYPDVFAAAASHSGVLSPLYAGPHPVGGTPTWFGSVNEIRKEWGRYWPSMGAAFGSDTATWWSRDPGRRLARLIATRGRGVVPALYADVGTGDALADESRAFKATVEQRGAALAYHEWPGVHDWTYVRAHVGESLSWIAAIIAR